MPRELALAYTGVAAAQLREWELRGAVNFVARGPRGKKIVLRSALDAALVALFSSDAVEDGDIEFD
jgi:hypothetical protein